MVRQLSFAAIGVVSFCALIIISCARQKDGTLAVMFVFIIGLALTNAVFKGDQYGEYNKSRQSIRGFISAFFISGLVGFPIVLFHVEKINVNNFVMAEASFVVLFVCLLMGLNNPEGVLLNAAPAGCCRTCCYSFTYVLCCKCFYQEYNPNYVGL